jgi:hypothetical protein
MVAQVTKSITLINDYSRASVKVGLQRDEIEKLKRRFHLIISAIASVFNRVD